MRSRLTAEAVLDCRTMAAHEDAGMRDTSAEEYARRLQAKQEVWWKKALNVQAPYQWNLRRQGLGRTLDVGCGIGRNLETLAPGSVGVDHNAAAVEVARGRGVTALTVEEWQHSDLRQPESSTASCWRT